MILDSVNLFSDFFRSIQTLVGHEANYQAALQHQLSYVTSHHILREHVDERTGRGGIDVVVRNSNGSALEMAFEIKGGAYGDRNALSDRFDSDGYCSDFDRLVKLQAPGVECWMVAIDALELGTGLNYRALQSAIEHARQRKLGFAYYALGREAATIVDTAGNKSHPVIPSVTVSGKSYVGIRPAIVDTASLSELLKTEQRVYEKEADIVGRIYSELCKINCVPSQMSLETYFGFAPRATGMHQRPDICIYEPAINGQFNLYPGGDRNLSNDRLKLESLRCVIEVKGSLSLRSTSDKVLLKKYLADIEKMQNWRGRIEKARRQYQLPSQQVDYVFIALDHREKQLSRPSTEMLLQASEQAGLFCHYVHHACSS